MSENQLAQIITNTAAMAATGASAAQVQGTAADGAAAVGKPVQVGGVDGSANVQAFLTDTSGRLIPGASENHLGEVGGNGSIVDLTFSLDTSGAYSAGDVLADTQELASAVRVNAGTALLQSVVLFDEDDQGQALDLVFFDANVSLGTENGAVSITDANARNILGIVSIASGDWKDLGGVRVATKSAVGLLVKGATGSTSIYVGAVSQGTGTYTASGIRARFALNRN